MYALVRNITFDRLPRPRAGPKVQPILLRCSKSHNDSARVGKCSGRHHRPADREQALAMRHSEDRSDQRTHMRAHVRKVLRKLETLQRPSENDQRSRSDVKPDLVGFAQHTRQD